MLKLKVYTGTEPSAETTKPTGTTTEPIGTTIEPTGTTTEPTGTTTEPTGTTTEPSGEVAGSKGPTSEHPSTTGDTHFKAAQADIRDPATSATTDPKVETERKNVDDSGAGLDESKNPAKVDGPGPKPIDEVAAQRGGDAGKVEGAGSSESKLDAAGGAAGGEGLKDEGKDKGTGEKLVKTSGLQADGGDFDATKPGAGREADRKFEPFLHVKDRTVTNALSSIGLLEEKGIANPAAAAAGAKKDEATTNAPEHEEEGKEKKSLKDKIKAKLHKN